MELYYKRVESVRKGRVHPARTQTVVIFLPDVRSCLPTRFEWDELSLKYKKHLQAKLHSHNTKSEDRELATVDRVEKKLHTTSSSGGDESINDGDDHADGDDIGMDDGSNNKLEKSTVADQQKADSTSTDAAKPTTTDESSGTPTATEASAPISKALHKNIISK